MTAIQTLSTFIPWITLVLVIWLVAKQKKDKNMTEAVQKLSASVSGLSAFASGELSTNAAAVIAIATAPDAGDAEINAITSTVDSARATLQGINDRLAAAVPPATPTITA